MRKLTDRTITYPVKKRPRSKKREKVTVEVTEEMAKLLGYIEEYGFTAADIAYFISRHTKFPATFTCLSKALNHRENK